MSILLPMNDIPQRGGGGRQLLPVRVKGGKKIRPTNARNRGLARSKSRLNLSDVRALWAVRSDFRSLR